MKTRHETLIQIYIFILIKIRIEKKRVSISKVVMKTNCRLLARLPPGYTTSHLCPRCTSCNMLCRQLHYSDLVKHKLHKYHPASWRIVTAKCLGTRTYLIMTTKTQFYISPSTLLLLPSAKQKYVDTTFKVYDIT